MSRNHRTPSSRHRLGDRRGAVAVEVALLVPALIMLMFGVIEFGHALWVKNALDFSVAQAARCASINPTLCETADQIQSYAADQAGIAFDKSDFTVSNRSCGNQVAAHHPMQLAIPFAPLSVTINATACYPS
jgi:Flp pilus assembly protein TadG